MRTMCSDELDVTCLATKNVAGEMRRRMEYRLTAWRLSAIAYDTCLVATELITNACAATPGGEIRIRCRREPAAVLVDVWDASDRMPVVRLVAEPVELDLSPDRFDQNGGWGLPLVRAIAAECGVHRTVPAGKWVWARLAAPR
jgi:anti-sigma regulatory factor (Ser/Thr protein kinase)